MGKTLKNYSYRGINVYIRWLGGLWYEATFPYKNEIFCHQLQLLKPRPNERRNSIDERHAGATAELQMIIAGKVDWLLDHRFERSVEKIKTKIKNKCEKLKQVVNLKKEGELKKEKVQLPTTD